MKTATETQIKEWKEKHKDIYLVTVDDKGCYLRKPTRKEISYATMMGKSDPLKFSEAILNSCWLDGDDEIKTDDELFMGVAGQLAELVKVKEAEIKKL